MLATLGGLGVTRVVVDARSGSGFVDDRAKVPGGARTAVITDEAAAGCEIVIGFVAVELDRFALGTAGLAGEDCSVGLLDTARAGD